MPFPSATKNDWLTGQDIDFLSLHSGFPGTTGANEISGGTPAYARKANTLAAPSGGSRLLSGASAFDVPACTVSWIGAWKSGTFVFCAANGGATPKNFSMSSGVLIATGHGWSTGQQIVFFGVPPTGATEGTVYFVRDATSDTFNIASTSGGSAIVLSGSASAGCWAIAITLSVYASQGTHTVSSGTVICPD